MFANILITPFSAFYCSFCLESWSVASNLGLLPRVMTCFCELLLVSASYYLLLPIMLSSFRFAFVLPSPEAANVHNRWRLKGACGIQGTENCRPQRGRTSANRHFFVFVRPFGDEAIYIYSLLTAGFARKARSTSGYGYSPPLATLGQIYSQTEIE